MTIALEICVDDSAGVDAALAGGADRLELCTALALGGLTPTGGFVARACAAAAGRAAVHAMVRPRAGDFVYDALEERAAADDAALLLAAGIDGLVFGATRDGTLDHALLARWVAGVRAIHPGIPLTLHRAIDTLADPVAAIADARALGFDRVLTSGGAATAAIGAAVIARMVAAAAGSEPVVMAGSGIDAGNARALVAATGVAEIHASASRPVAGIDRGAAALGFADPPRRATDVGAVRALRTALDMTSDQERSCRP